LPLGRGLIVQKIKAGGSVARRLARQWRELRQRFFPERQFIFRSRGDVRYVALGSGSQMLLAGGVVVFASWIGYASVQVFYRDDLLSARDRRISELTLAYDRLARDYERSQENFLTASRNLEQRMQDLALAKGLTPGAADTDQKTGGRQSSRAPAQSVNPPMPAAPQGPPAIIPGVATIPVQPAVKPDPAPRTATAVANLPVARPEPEQAPRNIEDLEAMLRAARQGSTPPLQPKAGDIEQRLLALRAKPREMLDELSNRDGAAQASLEKALRRVGVDLDGLIRRHAQARADVGVGGPFQAPTPAQLADAGSATQPGATDALDSGSESRQGRLGDLLALAQRLPLALPMSLNEVEVSSGFGRRVDPFTKQWAFHAGMDFIGPRQAPVFSTAPGVVVFAGRKGPYGRAVEIDHGLGLKTRFAHLSAIAVQVGDTVAFNRRIGTMGSTGRSTGQHLHYEILFDDDPIDPSKFIEAGTHVFKQQEDGTGRQ